MRVILCAAAASILLAGCSSSNSEKPDAQTSTTPATSSATSRPASSPTNTATQDPVAAEIAQGEYPACKLTVGEPQSLVVPSGDKSQVDVRCYTGTSIADDSTGGSVTNCDPTDTTSAKIYYWLSTSASAPDQNVYAAKAGGVVVIVPNETATEFQTIGGGLAAILTAVGVC